MDVAVTPVGADHLEGVERGARARRSGTRGAAAGSQRSISHAASGSRTQWKHSPRRARHLGRPGRTRRRPRSRPGRRRAARPRTRPRGGPRSASPSRGRARPRSPRTADPPTRVTTRPVSSSTSRVSPSRTDASVASITPPGVLQSSEPFRRWLQTSSSPSSASSTAPATVHSCTGRAMPPVWHARSTVRFRRPADVVTSAAVTDDERAPGVRHRPRTAARARSCSRTPRSWSPACSAARSATGSSTSAATGDCTLEKTLGALIGGVGAAVGVGVVAVLALRAMAEWRRPPHDRATGGDGGRPGSNRTARPLPPARSESLRFPHREAAQVNVRRRKPSA